MYRFLIPAFGLTFLCAFFTGATVNAWMFHPAPSLTFITDETPAVVPVVHIDGIRNGALVGSITGSVRLVARDKIILPAADASFSITDSKLLTNMIEIHVPPGMKFVASKKGTKYYPVGSASANNLAPANWIYFPDEQAAQRSGYKK